MTQGEITAGLKEALTLGANTVGDQLSKPDGYFRDVAIKIPLPNTLQDIQENLSKVGLSGPLDDLEIKINRAAEAAAPRAKTLVVDAVRSMTIEDAIGILNGGDTAATDFLKAKTSDALVQAFRPYVSDALDNSGAYRSVESVAGKYLPAGMVSGARDDLTDHAVDGALDGMFHYIAKEEQAIRRDPVRRTTELLRKVFGR